MDNIENVKDRTCNECETEGMSSFIAVMNDLFGEGRYRYTHTEGDFERFDVTAWDYNGRIIFHAEIKMRHIWSYKYITEGFLIEKGKAEKLAEFKKGVYWCNFKDCIMVWDTNKIQREQGPFTYFKRLSRKSSAVDTKNKDEKENKDMHDLSFDDASVFRKDRHTGKVRKLTDSEKRLYKEHLDRKFYTDELIEEDDTTYFYEDTENELIECSCYSYNQ